MKLKTNGEKNLYSRHLLLHTLCARVVCLFRKKTHRLRDVNDDAFKEEDEDKEEEDTSSASIFR